MADENIDLTFLGEQIKRLQTDVRDVKARMLLLESDQGELRQDFLRLERKFDVLVERYDNRFDHVDDRFNQVDARFNQVDARFNRLVGYLEEQFRSVSDDLRELRVAVASRKS
jgi:hypothetical protein